MFTYAFNSLGCIARMYTSHAEGGGFAMIRGFALGAVYRESLLTAELHEVAGCRLITLDVSAGLLLNATTLMQILSYGSGKAKAKKA